MAAQSSELPGYWSLPEPELAFHPTRSAESDRHPLRGLVNFGPFSASLLGDLLNPIRMAMIAPYGQLPVIDAFLREMAQSHQPKERRAYLVEFPGFEQVFRVRLELASSEGRIELPALLDEELASTERPHVVLAEALTRGLKALLAHRDSFDIVLIYLPDAWQAGFFGAPGEDFDLHDHVKAFAASVGLPTQLLRQGSAMSYPCRASVMWRVGIAVYCKAGGIPWKLAGTSPEEAFVGLSYSLRPKVHDQPQFVTCCSQVFDADGAGLQFIAYETRDLDLEGDNPFLSREDMRRVMARTLALYQHRRAGQLPRRLVIHKTTEFKRAEVDGCFDAFGMIKNVELVQVQDNVPWRGVKLDPPRGGGSRGTPSMYPGERGTTVQLGGIELLLWTQGNAPTAVGGRDFFKEGKGIPQPLLLRRFAGQGALDQLGRDVLGLTKMDWNNDALYDRLPVTLAYAQVLARTIKRMPTLASRPYQLRFFM